MDWWFKWDTISSILLGRLNIKGQVLLSEGFACRQSLEQLEILFKKEHPIQPYQPIHYIYSLYIDKTTGNWKSWYFKGSTVDYEVLDSPEFWYDWGLRKVLKWIILTRFLIGWSVIRSILCQNEFEDFLSFMCVHGDKSTLLKKFTRRDAQVEILICPKLDLQITTFKLWTPKEPQRGVNMVAII